MYELVEDQITYYFALPSMIKIKNQFVHFDVYD